jgi:hypothetical protein
MRKRPAIGWSFVLQKNRPTWLQILTGIGQLVGNSRQALRARSLGEEPVVKLVMIITAAIWTNRIHDGLQTPLL